MKESLIRISIKIVASMFTFDWEFAPRIAVVRDIRGDGKQKISGFHGRYYDPARNNLTQFAGSLLDRWFSFRCSSVASG